MADGEFGVLVTLDPFSRQARDFADSKGNLRLIDGDEVVRLVLEHYDALDPKYKGLIPLRRGRCTVTGELIAWDPASLDIFWLCDESFEDTDNLQPPAVIAAEIAEDLDAAVTEFAYIGGSLSNGGLA